MFFVPSISTLGRKKQRTKNDEHPNSELSFLNPWYLIGALAIVGPILLHLRRRPPKEFVPFSTLMFLEKTPERLTRRSKLERLWLLLLRCAVLLLLALLFARPFMNSDEAGAESAEGRRIVILLDKSASMQREDLWDRAVQAADEVLAAATGRDEVILATFDDQVTLVNEGGGSTADGGTGEGTAAGGDAAIFSRPNRALQVRLGDLEVGWRGSDLGGALMAAADLLEAGGAQDGADRTKEVVVISDFQEGAERDSLSRYAWPETVAVRCRSVLPKQESNLTLNLVATIREVGGDAGRDQGTAADAVGSPKDPGEGRQRVRIRSSRKEGAAANFSLHWEEDGAGAGGDDESAAAVVKGSVPPGGSRVVAVPPRSAGSEDADGVLWLSGDGHDFDNRAWVARVQPRPIRVLYLAEKIDPEDPGSALFYLLRAMQPTLALTPTVEAKTFSGVVAEEVESAEVLVVDGAPNVDTSRMLGMAVENGAALLWLFRSGQDEDSAVALAEASGASGWKFSEAEQGDGDYAMLSDLDFSAGVLAPFARAKVRDFSGIHIWRYRQIGMPQDVDGRAKVLARYDGGAPAWVQLPHGAGRMYLFSSGWEPAESQLALSSKFVPLLYAMLGEAGFSALAPAPLVVGEPLPVPPQLVPEDRVTVQYPGGERAESKLNEGVFRATQQPGIYSVTHDGGQSVYAVNLAAAEGRVESFDPLTLADFSIPILLEDAQADSAGAIGSAAQRRAAEQREKAIGEQRRLEKAEKEQRQKLWKWLVLAVLAVLLLETWVAGRRGQVAGEGGSEPAEGLEGEGQHA